MREHTRLLEDIDCSECVVFLAAENRRIPKYRSDATTFQVVRLTLEHPPPTYKIPMPTEKPSLTLSDVIIRGLLRR